MSADQDKPEKSEKKPGKGKRMMQILIPLACLGLGGGAAYGLVVSGMITNPAGKDSEPDLPRLLRKGESDPYAPPPKDGEQAPSDVIDGSGGNEYRTIYYVFPDEFTSNLKGSTSLIQVSLAASTHRDGRVLMWLKKHELAERSAMLAVLADTPESDIETIEGKEQLQKRLTGAINKVLIQNEGFGGVDAVYFKTFVIQ